MKKAKFNFKEAGSVFCNLSQDYKIFAPIKKRNGGRFSDTDVVTYDYVNSFEEIEFLQKSYYSAKEVFFPVRNTLFELEDNEMIESQDNFPNTIVFLRS